MAMVGNNGHHLRDVSFSSYLNPDERSYLLKLVCSSPNALKRKEEEDGEIGVFGAEKYFRESMNEETPKITSMDATKQVLMKPETLSTIPSLQSESARNSQSALLLSTVVTNPPPPNTTTKRNGKRFIAVLKYKCFCLDKESVDVDDHVAKNRLKTGTKEPIRTGPDPQLAKKMYWDDTVSDASSDLFEIESLAGRVNPVLSRQTSNATNCYAPSEASIDWSVATASAADFSVISDYEEGRRPIKTEVANEDREILKKFPGILFGCKSQNAVRVVGMNGMVSANNPGRSLRLDHKTPLTWFQSETMPTSYKYGEHGLATQSFRHLQPQESPHLSRAFSDLDFLR